MVSLADETDEGITHQIGLRKIELVRECQDGTRRAFGFRVNNQSVFCRGVNWIPADAMPGRLTEAHLRKLLSDLRDGSMNMVRV